MSLSIEQDIITASQIYVYLTYRVGSSNKQWSIRKVGGQYRVLWGRIGSLPAEQVVSMEEALKRLREKIKKGYQIQMVM